MVVDSGEMSITYFCYMKYNNECIWQAAEAWFLRREETIAWDKGNNGRTLNTTERKKHSLSAGRNNGWSKRRRRVVISSIDSRCKMCREPGTPTSFGESRDGDDF